MTKTERLEEMLQDDRHTLHYYYEVPCGFCISKHYLEGDWNSVAKHFIEEFSELELILTYRNPDKK